MTLKNGSTSTIIAASIIILDKNTNEPKAIRRTLTPLLASGTVGTLDANVMTGVTDEKAQKNFWNDHTWYCPALYGVH